MGVRVSGGTFTILGLGLRWDRTPGDEAVARSVVIFLEDRRLLFGERHVEDEAHCVASALACRSFLTSQISAAIPDEPLEVTLKAMRAAFRQFVERAGPRGQNFYHRGSMYETDPFSLALGDLRSRVGEQLARIAWRYEIEIDDDLARILPPEDEPDEQADTSWMVGFDHD